MAQQSPLQKKEFEHLDIPDLLRNIWEYSDDYYKNCVICDQYKKWCVEIARSKWQPYFKTFSFAISQIQIQNKNFFDFGKICSADKNYIYQVIRKRTFCIKNNYIIFLFFLVVEVTEVHF